ncbi:MAG: hypothetical protein RIQ56_287 [Candidatus Parcubacteria bacterium]|jgi:signal peptide peptidase SppA
MEPSQGNAQRIALPVSIAAAFGACLAVLVTALGVRMIEKNNLPPAMGMDFGYQNPPSCNVMGFQVHGEIVQSRASVPPEMMVPIAQSDGSTFLATPNYSIANELVDSIRLAASDETIKGIIIDIDSPGGGVVSGQELADVVRRSGKPSVAVIHELGASAGYLVASAAETVFAGRNSSIGSIGVTMSYLDQVEKNKKDGYTYQVLSSGRFKDSGSPDKTLTQDEKELFMRDVKLAHEHFVDLVSQYRSLPKEEVAKIADGSTVMGDAALSLRLIDQIGNLSDAIIHLENRLGEPVSICWR